MAQITPARPAERGMGCSGSGPRQPDGLNGNARGVRGAGAWQNFAKELGFAMGAIRIAWGTESGPSLIKEKENTVTSSPCSASTATILGSSSRSC